MSRAALRATLAAAGTFAEGSGGGDELTGYWAEVAADNPIHWWRLGDTADHGSSPVALTFNGGLTPTAGSLAGQPDDSHLELSPGASGKYGSIASLDLSGATRVLEFWYKTAGFNSPYNSMLAGIFDDADANNAFWVQQGWGAGFAHAGKLDAKANINGSFFDVSSGNIYDTDSAHHVVLRYDGTWTSVWADGVKQAQTNAFSGPLHATGKFWIGWSSFGNQYHQGGIDEVAIYAALSDARIAAHYAAGS
jgi:hypothetical protein